MTSAKLVSIAKGIRVISTSDRFYVKRLWGVAAGCLVNEPRESLLLYHFLPYIIMSFIMLYDSATPYSRPVRIGGSRGSPSLLWDGTWTTLGYQKLLHPQGVHTGSHRIVMTLLGTFARRASITKRGKQGVWLVGLRALYQPPTTGGPWPPCPPPPPPGGSAPDWICWILGITWHFRNILGFSYILHRCGGHTELQC